MALLEGGRCSGGWPVGPGTSAREAGPWVSGERRYGVEQRCGPGVTAKKKELPSGSGASANAETRGADQVGPRCCERKSGAASGPCGAGRGTTASEPCVACGPNGRRRVRAWAALLGREREELGRVRGSRPRKRGERAALANWAAGKGRRRWAGLGCCWVLGLGLTFLFLFLIFSISNSNKG